MTFVKPSYTIPYFLTKKQFFNPFFNHYSLCNIKILQNDNKTFRRFYPYSAVLLPSTLPSYQRRETLGYNLHFPLPFVEHITLGSACPNPAIPISRKWIPIVVFMRL
jgi:hypothetical protein